MKQGFGFQYWGNEDPDTGSYSGGMLVYDTEQKAEEERKRIHQAGWNVSAIRPTEYREVT